jgi:gliding motility-associated-like protein
VYTVSVTDQEGNTAERPVLVQVIEGQVNAGPDRTIPCTNDPIVLEGSSGIANGTVAWSTTNGRITAGGSTYTPTVDRPGTYVLSVLDPLSGCTFTDAAVVVYGGGGALDLSGLAFPNVITPNSDGRNEGFFPFLANDPGIDLSGLTTDYELSIYNRWGQLVFNTGNASDRWAGRTEAGERVPDGVYFFVARLKVLCSDGREIERTGHIQVLN